MKRKSIKDIIKPYFPAAIMVLYHLFREWERIRIVGGEPTLHKDISKILDVLLKYKNIHSPNTIIELTTNGFGNKVNAVLSQIPKQIEIRNTHKKSPIQSFTLFNTALKDHIMHKFVDYSNACWVTSHCGIGLTPYGYYPCAVAGGIDRILGFNCGRKKLPPPDDSMADLLKVFCKYCGHFRDAFSQHSDQEVISRAWKRAYEEYKKRKPNLTPY